MANNNNNNNNNNKMLVVLWFLVSALMVTTSTKVVVARDFVSTASNSKRGEHLATRLNGKSGGGVLLGECWNSLIELRSCTNEIILFLVDGEAYLGLPCCRAIRIITRECWPNMLTSLGFSAEEGDILRGYCDDASSSSSPAPSPVSFGITPLPVVVQPPAHAPLFAPTPIPAPTMVVEYKN